MTGFVGQEAPPCILVAESDEALQDKMCRALREAGYRVDDAVSAQRALRRLAAEPVDVLITALMLCDGDGFELITSAKRERAAGRILAISGRGMFGGYDILRVAELIGADAALAKPFAIDQLLARVAELVKDPPPRPVH
jgi:two-component system chemotaxis response regulator CheY